MRERFTAIPFNLFSSKELGICNKVRLVRLIFILSAVLAGCKKEGGLSPLDVLNGSAKRDNLATDQVFPFGKYNLFYYENGYKVPYDVVLEFKNEVNSRGDFIVSGKSCVNFYFATQTFNTDTNEVSILNLSSTKISGSEEKLEFEKDYLDRLASVVSYEIDSNRKKLILRMPESNNQYMVFVLDSN